MLVNLSADQEVLEALATDEKFLDVLFSLIVVRALATHTHNYPG
jgi:hypothetical protein